MSIENFHQKYEDIQKLKSAARKKNLINKREKIYFNKNSIIPSEFIRLDPWEIEYLFLLANQSKKGIIETGRYFGGSTLVLSYANKKVPIYSIDNDPKDDAFLSDLMKKLDVGKNVNLIIDDSGKNKPTIISEYDVVFIDGDHSYQGCMNDLVNWWEGLPIGGHIICHDCYFGREVQDAVMDFLIDKRVNMYLTPLIPRNHNEYSFGSLCHFQKV